MLVIVGGIIPDADIPALKERAWPRSSPPAPPLPSIGTWLAEALDRREEALGA